MVGRVAVTSSLQGDRRSTRGAYRMIAVPALAACVGLRNRTEWEAGKSPRDRVLTSAHLQVSFSPVLFFLYFTRSACLQLPV